VLFLHQDHEPPRLPILVGTRPPYTRDATIWLVVELSGAALSAMADRRKPGFAISWAKRCLTAHRRDRRDCFTTKAKKFAASLHHLVFISSYLT
jgi:hypothetical protein